MMFRAAALLFWWSLLLPLVLVLPSCAATDDEYTHQELQNDGIPDQEEPLGVDSSWPTHHLPDRYGRQHRDRIGHRYSNYMEGCARQYSQEACEESDLERRLQNLYQPRAQQNYTSAGYAKVTTPTAVLETLRYFYAKHQHEHRIREAWPPSNIYVNHWTSPTYLVPLQGKQHPSALTVAETRELVALIQPILETWSKMPLILTSLYGIREYNRGAILAPHVDRAPLIISAIIPVEQVGFEDGEEWPLEVIGHDGVPKNITMRPGEMVLYESHSIIHGRPYPMNGLTYASVFVHFEPVGHTERHNSLRNDPETLYQRAFQKQKQRMQRDHTATSTAETVATEGQEASSQYVSSDDYTNNNQNLPYYVPRDKADQWNQNFVFVREPKKESNDEDSDAADKPPDGTIASYSSLKHHAKKAKRPHFLTKNDKSDGDAAAVADNHYNQGRLHREAAIGNLVQVKAIVEADPLSVKQTDINDWLPLHEAARAGHTHIVEYLLKFMDEESINALTNAGLGGSPLWWAEHNLEEDHSTIKALKRAGAKRIAPRTK